MAITVCWCKQPTSNSFQMCLYSECLFKLCDTLIIILMTNGLTNVCNKMRKKPIDFMNGLHLQCEEAGGGGKVG